MNPMVLERAGWSRKRLASAIVIAFILQGGLVIWLGQRSIPAPKRPVFPAAIYLAADSSAAAKIASDDSLDDPTLLALPSLDGFSGSAWMKFPAFDYVPPESNEPPQFLELEPGSLGTALSEFLRTNLPAQISTTDRPLPPLQRFEPNYPPDPVAQESTVRFEGDLASRRLYVPWKLKSWPHPEILSNTVVQAAVDADGFAVSKTLLSGSGKREADDYALTLVADARWQPPGPRARHAKGADSLAWGKLVFQWHTLPMPATNLQAIGP